MNPAKKISAGAVAVVLAASAGLPGITGSMLESRLNDQLENTAAKYNYSVASVSLDRGFYESSIEIELEGINLRELSRESLTINGMLSHNSLFGLPDLVTGDLDFTYSLYQEGIRLNLPGSIEGSISLNGNIAAVIATESMELPLDSAAQATMKLNPASAELTVSGQNDQQVVQIDLNSLSWDIFEHNQFVGAMSLAPSHIHFLPAVQQWSMTIPALTMVSEHFEDDQAVTLENINASGVQSSQNDLFSSRVELSTAGLTIPALSGSGTETIFEGMRMTSSMENISHLAISKLADVLQQAQLVNNEDAVFDSAKEFVLEVSQYSPKMALEDLTLKTANGELSFSFEIEGTEKAATVAQKLLESEEMTQEQEFATGIELLESINSATRITLSDELIDWGCEQVGQQMAFESGASPVQARLAGNMCKTVAKTGDFLSLACFEIEDPMQQYQCLSAVDQAKSVWVKNRTLELAFKDGKLQLNGATIELPVAM